MTAIHFIFLYFWINVFQSNADIVIYNNEKQ